MSDTSHTHTMPKSIGETTTEELIRELISRFEMDTYAHSTSVEVHQSVKRALILAEMLGGMNAHTREYRTTHRHFTKDS